MCSRALDVFDEGKAPQRQTLRLGFALVFASIALIVWLVNGSYQYWALVVAAVFLFSHSSNVLFSRQPYYYGNSVSPWYRRAFDFRATAAEAQASRQKLTSDLDAYMTRAADTQCGQAIAGQALGFFTGGAALELQKAVARWAAESKARSIPYANTEMVLPPELEQRQPNFIDNAHMSDLGQQRITGFFARKILNTDLGMPFDRAAYVEAVYAEPPSSRGCGQ